MRCFNGSSTEYSLLVDAPDATGVPLMDMHPLVPIVVDGTPVHKRTQVLYRQFSDHIPYQNFRDGRFATMEGVWKRLTIRYAREFLKHIIPAILKPARTLWNEVIGFLFLSFAAVFGFRAVHYAMDYRNGGPTGGTGALIRLAMAGFCTFVMAWYGVSSFLRARKISRS